MQKTNMQQPGPIRPFPGPNGPIDPRNPTDDPVFNKFLERNTSTDILGFIGTIVTMLFNNYSTDGKVGQ